MKTDTGDLYFDFSQVPMQIEIVCPSCGGNTRLDFRPGTRSAWGNCNCGRGWDMPIQPGTSQAVN